jgi:hypothetical protein
MLTDLPTYVEPATVKELVATIRAAGETIEDVVVALGLHATARVKDGQGELPLRILETPPVRARV